MKKNKLLLILFALLAFGQMAWAQDIVSVNYVDEQGETQTVNATSIDHIASVNPNGATIGSTGFANWYVVQGSNVIMNGQLGYYGGINLILCDGASLTINTTDEDAIHCLTGNLTLTIYVQSQGTGQLVATATSSDNDYKTSIRPSKRKISPSTAVPLTPREAPTVSMQAATSSSTEAQSRLWLTGKP